MPGGSRLPPPAFAAPLDATPVAPAERAATVEPCVPCFHCGLPVKERGRFSVAFRGRLEPLCCAGCEAVAGTIIGQGLSTYYDHRATPSARAPAPLPEAVRDLTLWDRPDLQASFTRATEGDVCESALIVEGIQCPACAWLIDQRLRATPGIVDAAIDYTTRRLRVRWLPDVTRLSTVIGAVTSVGYTAHPYDHAQAEVVRRREWRAASWRLGLAGLAMMQVMMYAWPAYVADAGEMTADVAQLMRIAGLLITAPVMVWSASPFMRGAWRDLRLRRAGMDVPIALALVVAFVASTWSVVRAEGDVWFDSITMFVFLLLAGRMLEMLARDRAARAIEDLARQAPLVARRLLDWPRARAIEPVAAPSLGVGDHVVVEAGEVAPADGVVVDGRSTFDESALTGESRPVEKIAGARVIGGTINQASAVIVRIDRVGPDTWLAAIQRMVEQANATRPRIVLAMERHAGRFIAVILALAVLTGVAWWFVDPARALHAAIAVLVVTCPCALSLATPIALACSTARLAREGVLVADGTAIERLAVVDAIAFDKTGSLTEGRPRLARIVPLAGSSEDACLAVALTLEQHARHPMAQAVVDAAAARGIGPVPVDAVIEVPGSGVEGRIAGRQYRIGTAAHAGALVREGQPDLPDPEATAAGAQSSAWLGTSTGFLARLDFDDAVRPDAAATIATLRGLGLDVSILSGDGEGATRAVAGTLGVDKAEGRLRPEDKRERIAALQHAGRRVAMVGDGVNDGPVLAQADVSIAMAGGASLARHAAGIVLGGNALGGIVTALDVARRTTRIVRQNLAWAFAYNVACVPLAALGYMPPWLAGLGMALSSLIVVGNSMRLAPPRRPRRT